MKNKRFYRCSVPAVLVVVALALAGCSSSDAASGGKNAKKTESEESPLQKYLSALWDEGRFSEEAQAKQQAKTEELVATCMSKEGFEYTPFVYTGGMEVGSSGEEGSHSGMGTLKYAERYGYGTVDWPGRDEPFGGVSGGGASADVDPNSKYVASLSPAETEAYNATLWGAEFGRVDPEDEDTYEYDWTKAGCKGAAQHATQSSGEDAYEDPDFKELFAKIDEMNMSTACDSETPAANPDMAKLDQKWTECMAEAGYSYTHTLQPANEFNDEWNKIQNAAFDSETGAYKEPSKADQKEQDELTKKLQEREIKVAVVDAKCLEKLDYVNEEKRIKLELEQKFVDENRAELDAMLAKYGTKKKSK